MAVRIVDYELRIANSLSRKVGTSCGCLRRCGFRNLLEFAEKITKKEQAIFSKKTACSTNVLFK
jgi:hypothetical protein